MTYPKSLKRLFNSLLMGGQTLNYIFKRKISRSDLAEQMFEAGPGSYLIVLVTGIAAGTVFNIQVASQLSSMGVSSEIGGLLSVGMAREMAPLLTATLMTGKVATSYAAQLGTMKVTEQIEAITMLKTDPVEYLVVPRLLAMLIMSPIQCLLFLIVAVWSGQIWSTIFYNVPFRVFWTSVVSGTVHLTSHDLMGMIVKSFVFGFQIAIIACGWGLTTKGGPKEVGVSTTGAVVMTLVTVSIVDVILTQILFG
tara:strand:+ start:509 stop:1264 length:756 start_codon:yes stop_codon:yes gene_type:complete